MENKYDNFPFYQDSPFCTNCGHVLKEQILVVNLQLEPDYKRRIMGQCRKCDVGYDFTRMVFTGADNEKYIGTFDTTGTIVTTSGRLTTYGKWDERLFSNDSSAKNFDLRVTVAKANSCG